MACLTHNSRYSHLFRAVVNELRKENRIPVCKLRNMSRQCCTCNNVDNQILTTVVTDDTVKLINLKKIIDQIDRDKDSDPKLILSLNQLENFIKENRILDTNVLSTSIVDNEIKLCSQDSMMDIDPPLRTDTTKQTKPLNNGKFIYLPYKFDKKPDSDALLEVAKKLQRGRFISRNGYIASLEKEHNVCINMVTPKTTKKVKKTLEIAKAGIGNVSIHNRTDLPEVENGEWILVRQKKKTEDKSTTVDFETLLDDLANQWTSFLKIRKRKFDEESDEENEEHANKK
ncbi:unnamed protein product [Rotaria sp. Silwood2]|nr:unnamed protein product [Rotaria sp. Silwood2]CAF3000609.1 unnamed protein product [Rotaria sp. Silwood2]CAF3332909.1 unnamed protein product [Rotaria sp. Silwood2]CAF3907482.1 unnamed protein product [Rotaria sp. Silwood2]CAF4044521.1 unnamed protein product [Rotaria sp. Silwood2]